MDANLGKQAQLMEAIERYQAAYKHAFGYPEWRQACEVCLARQLAQSRDACACRSSRQEPAWDHKTLPSLCRMTALCLSHEAAPAEQGFQAFGSADCPLVA